MRPRRLDNCALIAFIGTLVISSLLLLSGCSEQPPVQEPGLNIEIDISRPPKWSPVKPPGEFNDDYLRATCRLRGGGSGGSGTCYRIDGNFVYILTCKHVVDNTKTFYAEFWIDGRITGSYKGEVIKVLDVDAAVIAIPVGAFKDNELPVAIPISLTPPDADKPIISVGSPGLGWQTLFEGHITKYPGDSARLGGRSFEFIPPPKGGRSGSGIIQDRKIVGILWGSTGKEGYSVNCMDLQELIAKRGMFFTADWCKFCDEMGPVIAAMDGITVFDYDLNPSLARIYGVTKLPAYVNEAGEVMHGVRTKTELEDFYGMQLPIPLPEDFDP